MKIFSFARSCTVATRFSLILLAAILSVAQNAPAAVFEDYETYLVGSNLSGQGGWAGWTNDPNASGLVSSNFSFSPTQSVSISGSNNLVRALVGATNGIWVFSVKQYIPSTSSGTTYVSLLNIYRPPFGAADLNWSVRIQNNMTTGQVISDLGGGTTRPMVMDQWVDVRCEINLASNSVSEFYDGQLLSTHSWQAGAGSNQIQALDLAAQNGGPAYYDDMNLVELLTYTKTLPPGYSLIANQLDHGSNTADVVFPNPTGDLDGCRILQADCAGGYTVATFDSTLPT